MVKTRSSARVGSAAPSAPAENGTSSELRARLKTTENGHRSQRPYNQTRNNQSLSSGSMGPGSGSQGKDPLAPALPGSRALYQHPAVSGYNTQDSRGQNMPVSARQNPIYPSSMYHGYGGGGGGTLAPMPSPSPTAPLAPFPVHPDVKFRKLPFYDVLAELMKPSTMMPMQAGRMQEGTYVFHLTPQQATEIASGKDLVGTSNKLDYVIQAQLRFCLLETSCEQEDHFPPSVNVKVNNKMCPLPNPIPTNKPTPEPKRPPRPVNISSLVKLSPTVANTIQVTWAADFTRAYVLSVFMVRKLTSAELLQRLKNKGTKNPDYTRSLIKEKLSEDYDSEIATTSLRVSLMCPLGKMRMSCPCRPANCPHLQCFDASLFLQMNERKPTWLCPVCDRPAPYDSLVVDGYFQEVLTSSRLSSDCNEIQLHADGNWSAHAPPARAPQQAQPAAEPVTLISDDLEVIPVESGAGPGKRAAVGEARRPADVLVDLTSDSDDDAPLKRKVAQPKPTPPASESSVKSDDNYSSSSAAEAVSSSGYRSPGVPGAACGVISLDSPSPPAPASPPPGAPPAPAPAPAHAHIVPHDVLTDGPHLSITPVTTTAASAHLIEKQGKSYAQRQKKTRKRKNKEKQQQSAKKTPKKNAQNQQQFRQNQKKIQQNETLNLARKNNNAKPAKRDRNKLKSKKQRAELVSLLTSKEDSLPTVLIENKKETDHGHDKNCEELIFSQFQMQMNQIQPSINYEAQQVKGPKGFQSFESPYEEHDECSLPNVLLHHETDIAGDGSSTGAERDDAEATPPHWAPYAESDRDDNFRKY